MDEGGLLRLNQYIGWKALQPSNKFDTSNCITFVKRLLVIVTNFAPEVRVRAHFFTLTRNFSYAMVPVTAYLGSATPGGMM